MNKKDIILILFSLIMLSSSVVFYCYPSETKNTNINTNIIEKKKVKKSQPCEEKEEKWVIYLTKFREFIGFLGFLAFNLLLSSFLLKYILGILLIVLTCMFRK